jgi:hypothetical protein
MCGSISNDQIMQTAKKSLLKYSEKPVVVPVPPSPLPDPPLARTILPLRFVASPQQKLALAGLWAVLRPILAIITGAGVRVSPGRHVGLRSASKKTHRSGGLIMLNQERQGTTATEIPRQRPNELACFRQLRRSSQRPTKLQAARSSISCSKAASTSGSPRLDRRPIARATW